MSIIQAATREVQACLRGRVSLLRLSRELLISEFRLRELCFFHVLAELAREDGQVVARDLAVVGRLQRGVVFAAAPAEEDVHAFRIDVKPIPIDELFLHEFYRYDSFGQTRKIT